MSLINVETTTAVEHQPFLTRFEPDRTIALLVSSFLSVEDIFFLRCVGREWRSVVESSSGVDWKQVLTNSYGQHVVDKFVECSQRMDNSAPMPSFDLAKALERSISDQRPQKPVYDPPSVSTRDFFVVVDFYKLVKQQGHARRVSMGSVVVEDIRGMLDGDEVTVPEGTLRIQGPNPLHPETVSIDHEFAGAWLAAKQLRVPTHVFPLDYAYGAEVDQNDRLRIRSTLFRRDNLQSVLLSEVQHGEGYSWDDDERFHSEIHSSDWWTNLYRIPFQGGNALKMMHSEGYISVAVAATTRMRAADLPEPGSESIGYTWLSAMRHDSRHYVPQKTHFEELSQIRTFSFQLEALSLRFKIAAFDPSWGRIAHVEKFKDVNEMLVAVEGFHWM
jgi:hypothetical protein